MSIQKQIDPQCTDSRHQFH